jgi:hypothetical protein
MKTVAGLIGAALVLGACASASLNSTRRIHDSYARVEGAKVAAEIERWEGVARDAPDDALRAGAHLRLALLLSHPDQSEPDYRRALEELEGYRTLDPKGAEEMGVRRLQGVLSELHRCERRGERRREVVELLWKEEQEVRRRLEILRQDSRGADAVMTTLVEEGRALRRRNQELGRDNEDMARRIRDLEAAGQRFAEENRELQETLQRLKALDLQLERMRTGEQPR